MRLLCLSILPKNKDINDLQAGLRDGQRPKHSRVPLIKFKNKKGSSFLFFRILGVEVTLRFLRMTNIQQRDDVIVQVGDESKPYISYFFFQLYKVIARMSLYFLCDVFFRYLTIKIDSYDVRERVARILHFLLLLSRIINCAHQRN